MESLPVPQPDLSLSIVLPVHNIQNLLPMLVCELMEFVSDFVSHFELIVVDDGSTDQTDEVAADLALQYPQVRTVRHSSRLGGEAVIRTGSEVALGRVVIVQRENDFLRPADLLRLGQFGRQYGIVVPHLESTLDRFSSSSTGSTPADQPTTATPDALPVGRPKFLTRSSLRPNSRDKRS